MNKVEEATEQLIQAVTGSYEYTQFQNLQEELSQQPELSRQLGEYRRRKLEIQINSENCMEALRKLSSEYAQILEQGLAQDFLAAEQRFCRMMRMVNDTLTEAIAMDISFLEQ